MAVYRDKGCGFLERVYQECMEIELRLIAVPFEAQKHDPLFYKGNRLKQTYVPDLVCFGKIIVELKAVSRLIDEHRAQVLNYLNTTGCELGILTNFGQHPGIEIERLVLSKT